MLRFRADTPWLVSSKPMTGLPAGVSLKGMLFAYDTGAGQDRLWLQNPANAGTLSNPLSTGLDLGTDVGFDIAGSGNQGYLAGTPAGRDGARLYTVDVTTGKTRQLGRIDGGDAVVTGLAVWQEA